jgi:hypothetical protein
VFLEALFATRPLLASSAARRLHIEHPPCGSRLQDRADEKIDLKARSVVLYQVYGFESYSEPQEIQMRSLQLLDEMFCHQVQPSPSRAINQAPPTTP